MATIGLRDVYYSVLKTDPVGGTPTYDTPVHVAGAMTANINPNTSSATLFADDGPADTAATLGEITLELGMRDLDMATQAALLGHTVGADGVLIRKGEDVSPYVAVGFRTLKSDGTYRYYWLAKGKFQVPSEDLTTKGDSIEFQTPTITGSFVKRDSDGEWQRQADSSDTTAATAITNWFKSPLTVAAGG